MSSVGNANEMAPVGYESARVDMRTSCFSLAKAHGPDTANSSLNEIANLLKERVVLVGISAASMQRHSRAFLTVLDCFVLHVFAAVISGC